MAHFNADPLKYDRIICHCTEYMIHMINDQVKWNKPTTANNMFWNHTKNYAWKQMQLKQSIKNLLYVLKKKNGAGMHKGIDRVEYFPYFSAQTLYHQIGLKGADGQFNSECLTLRTLNFRLYSLQTKLIPSSFCPHQGSAFCDPNNFSSTFWEPGEVHKEKWLFWITFTKGFMSHSWVYYISFIKHCS